VADIFSQKILRPRAVAAAVVLAGFAAMLAVNLPGHLEFDSIRQLLEGRSGVYSNWHPPIMSWMLGVADAIEPGAALFVIFDATLAFGAILSLLWLTPRPTWTSVPAALVAVSLPQLFLFQAIVWKDMLFADACLAGFVCLAHAAVQWKRPRLRYVLLGGAVVFLSLAVLTRQSGAVVLPCAGVALGAIAARETTWKKGILFGAGFILAGAALSLGVNAALQQRASDALGPIEQLEDLQLYDMAGMLKRQPDLQLTSLERDAPEMAKRLREKAAQLYTPIQHDRLTDDPVIHGLIVDSVDPVRAQWRALVFANPKTYLAVRAEDFSWLFFSLHSDQCLVYEVGVSGDPADLRTAHLSRRYDDRDEWLDDDYGTPLVSTPALSHPFFAIGGLVSLLVFLRRRRPADLAMAGLLTAALLYTLSYFFISIACQYRYLFAVDLSSIAAVFYLLMDVRWPGWMRWLRLPRRDAPRPPQPSP
jgi:hypothetical protein